MGCYRHFPRTFGPCGGEAALDDGDVTFPAVFTENDEKSGEKRLHLNLHLMLRSNPRWQDGPVIRGLWYRLARGEPRFVVSAGEWRAANRRATRRGFSPLPNWWESPLRRDSIPIGAQHVPAYRWRVVAQPAFGPPLVDPHPPEANLYVIESNEEADFASAGQSNLEACGRIEVRSYTYFLPVCGAAARALSAASR